MSARRESSFLHHLAWGVEGLVGRCSLRRVHWEDEEGGGSPAAAGRDSLRAGSRSPVVCV